jgi:hypothetical protein
VLIQFHADKGRGQHLADPVVQLTAEHLRQWKQPVIDFFFAFCDHSAV